MIDGGGQAIGVAQFAPTADVDANLGQISQLAWEAADRGARMLVLPEYSPYFTPKIGPDWIANAQPLNGPFAVGLGQLAAKLGIYIVAGIVEQLPDVTGRIANTIVVFANDGGLIQQYRKIHLFDAFNHQESRYVVPGALDQLPIFTWRGFTVGLQTCYDVRFPEVTRRLADAGADLILLPAEWVHGPLKEAHWRTLVTARAIENTVYVAAASHPPPVGAGNSMVVDPMGVELLTIGETTDVAVGRISPQRVAQVRTVNPALELRRFGVVARESGSLTSQGHSGQ